MSSTALKDANYFGEEFGGKGEGACTNHNIAYPRLFCDQFMYQN